jgi:predicted dehydrogenase
MPRRHVKNPGEKIRVAVIGVGYLGKFHAEKYAKIPEVELVGLVDLLEDRARQWAEKLGTRAYADYRNLLGKVDAVSIVVPTDQHFPIARAFLEGGSDVLLEKPITSTLREAEDLIATARTCRRILQVGHLERFNPAFLAIRERIRAPLFLEVHRLTPFRQRGMEVDVVLDLMIHDLDIILSFVRSEAKSIQAVGVPVLTEKVDIANARVEFAGGCVANITASRVSLEDRRRIRVFQPETFVMVDYAAKKVAIFKRSANSANGGIKIETESVRVEPGDALENEIRSFIQCSQRRARPPVTGEDGKRALALALQIKEEIQKNLERIPSIRSFYERPEDLRDHPW